MLLACSPTVNQVIAGVITPTRQDIDSTPVLLTVSCPCAVLQGFRVTVKEGNDENRQTLYSNESDGQRLQDVATLFPHATRIKEGEAITDYTKM